MYFLVTGEVMVRHYMADGTEKNFMHLVEAVSEDDAEQKVRKHYDDSTRDYDVYYHVNSIEVHETLR